MNTNGAAVETETAEQLDRANAIAIGRYEAYFEVTRDLEAILNEPGTVDVRILARVRDYLRTVETRRQGSWEAARITKRQLAEAKEGN